MQQTETYKLNLIETSDPFSPDALNENAKTLDAKLAEIPFAVFGTYEGTGGDQDIVLGFKPRAVLVIRKDALTNNGGYPCGGLALPDSPATLNDNYTYHAVEIRDTGFRVSYRSSEAHTNRANYTYHYIAFR